MLIKYIHIKSYNILSINNISIYSLIQRINNNTFITCNNIQIHNNNNVLIYKYLHNITIGRIALDQMYFTFYRINNVVFNHNNIMQKTNSIYVDDMSIRTDEQINSIKDILVFLQPIN